MATIVLPCLVLCSLRRTVNAPVMSFSVVSPAVCRMQDIAIDLIVIELRARMPVEILQCEWQPCSASVEWVARAIDIAVRRNCKQPIVLLGRAHLLAILVDRVVRIVALPWVSSHS